MMRSTDPKIERLAGRDPAELGDPIPVAMYDTRRVADSWIRDRLVEVVDHFYRQMGTTLEYNRAQIVLRSKIETSIHIDNPIECDESLTGGGYRDLARRNPLHYPISVLVTRGGLEKRLGGAIRSPVFYLDIHSRNRRSLCISPPNLNQPHLPIGVSSLALICE